MARAGLGDASGDDNTANHGGTVAPKMALSSTHLHHNRFRSIRHACDDGAEEKSVAASHGAFTDTGNETLRVQMVI